MLDDGPAYLGGPAVGLAGDDWQLRKGQGEVGVVPEVTELIGLEDEFDHLADKLTDLWVCRTVELGKMGVLTNIRPKRVILFIEHVLVLWASGTEAHDRCGLCHLLMS